MPRRPKAAAEPKPEEAPTAAEPEEVMAEEEEEPSPESPRQAILRLAREHSDDFTLAIRQNPKLVPFELHRDPRLDGLIASATAAHAALQTVELEIVAAREQLDRVRSIIRRTPVPSR